MLNHKSKNGMISEVNVFILFTPPTYYLPNFSCSSSSVQWWVFLAYITNSKYKKTCISYDKKTWLNTTSGKNEYNQLTLHDLKKDIFYIIPYNVSIKFQKLFLCISELILVMFAQAYWLFIPHCFCQKLYSSKTYFS